MSSTAVSISCLVKLTADKNINMNFHMIIENIIWYNNIFRINELNSFQLPTFLI